MAEAAPKERGPKKPRRRTAPKRPAAGGAGGEPKEPREPRERKERPPTVPVPESYIGTERFGRVCDVLNHGRERFGFIYITPTDGFQPAAEEGKSGLSLYTSLPRIYFNAAEWKEAEGTRARKNDLVKFNCKKDDKDRPFASDVVFTPSGKTASAARDAAFAEAQKNAPPKAPRAESDRPKSVKKERVRDERTVELKVTCDDISGTKDITACLGDTIGKLKHSAVTAFEAPITHNVFFKGEKLTKAILATMSDGETIHIGPPKA